MAYPDNLPEPIRSFFTFRPGQPINAAARSGRITGAG